MERKNSITKNSRSKQVKAKTLTKVTTPKRHFPIIGIGASAGGLEAIESFFSQIPAKTGMAYVVITHLDREHTSAMAELIHKYTPMSVLTITNGLKIKANTVYVIPPRKNVTLKNETLHLSEQKMNLILATCPSINS